MFSRKKSTRREFLKTSAAAASLISVPYFVPATAFGANERVNTGHIGLGGQGRGNLVRLANHAVALSDVDSDHLARATKEVEKRGRKCEGYQDYRRMLDRKDIDAVVISTPDHWHSTATIHACEAGKDVYVEKPLTLTIAEGRRMVEAARANDRVVQTGSQQRSMTMKLDGQTINNFRYACELVRSGRIGKLQQVKAGIARANHPFGKNAPVPDSAPPSNLNYNLWLGPAPLRAYNEKRVHYNFRFFWDYSGGQMTNWGAHHIDIGHWGMGMDDSGPVEVIPELVEFHAKKWHEVTEKLRSTYKYPNGVTMLVGQLQSDIPMGTTFIGDKGTIYVNRGQLTSKPADIIKEPIKDGDVKLYESNNHHEDFINCVKSRKKPICDVEIGHRTATACHLGNIAARLNQTIKWDPKKEQILGDAETAGWIDRPHRSLPPV